jgi:hypothetical protein
MTATAATTALAAACVRAGEGRTSSGVDGEAGGGTNVGELVEPGDRPVFGTAVRQVLTAQDAAVPPPLSPPTEAKVEHGGTSVSA